MLTHEIVLEFLFSVAIVTFEIFCYVTFVDTFLARRWKGIWFIPVATLSFVAIHAVLSFFITSQIVGLLTSLAILFALALIFYTGQVPIKLMLAFFYWILLSAVDYGLHFGVLRLLGIDIGEWLEGGRSYAVFSSISKLVCFIIVFTIRCWWRRRHKIADISKQDYIYLLFYPLLSIFSIFVMADVFNTHQRAGAETIVFSTLIFISNIYMVRMIEAAAKRRKTEQEYEILQQQVGFGQIQLQTLTESQNQLRGQAHDYKNHLRHIHGLVSANENENAKLYIQQISDTVETSMDVINTHNPSFNAILNHKYAEMREKGIQVSIQIDSFEDYHGIAPHDLVTIVGNTIDNAVEACSKNPNSSEISITLQNRNGQFLYILTNTVAAPVEKSAFAATNKPDTASHGYGLANTMRAVSKYGGECDIFYKDNKVTFYCTI